MAYVINDHCIACDLCAAVCPNHAITPARPAYRISPYFCIECLGFADEPQCAAVCPAAAVVASR